MNGDADSGIRRGEPDAGRGVGDRESVGGEIRGADQEIQRAKAHSPVRISIAERRAGALLAKASEPTDSRKIILSLALTLGWDLRSVESLTYSDATYVVGLIAERNKRRGSRR